jgi:hypothetical protein
VITERLTDHQRRRVLRLLIAAVPVSTAPDADLRKLISMFSGSDTVVSVDRAYPSSDKI